MIYQKPLTEEEPEGVATLVELLRDRGEVQDWIVEFPDWYQAQRTIKTPQAQ